MLRKRAIPLVMQPNPCFNARMFQWWQRRVRRTTLISIGSAMFLVGLSLPTAGIVQAGSGLVLGASSLAVCCKGRRLLLAVPAIVLCGLLLGIWRGSVVHESLAIYKENLGHKVELQGTLSQDTTFGTKGELIVYLSDVSLGSRQAPGMVRITTFSPIEPRRGDIVQIKGKLTDGFGSYQAAVYFASIQVVKPSTSWLEQIRRSFTANILNNLPEPQASLGLGFLIGLKSQLPSELTKELQLLSLTHIVVASGFNLTVLVRLSRRLFAKRSRYQAALSTALLMSGFLVVTGLSASMTRAVLVTSLSLAAWYYGRKIHPIVLLLVSAALTAGVYPFYLWGDIGWWLSFLAFAGVMLGAPLVAHRLYSERPAPALAQIVLETICAQLAALPVLLYSFGAFSVLALPANILVVPFIPLGMLLTGITGLVAWVIPPLAPWIALPAVWLLSYMTSCISWLSHISWASVPLGISVITLGSLYAILIAIGLLLYKKLRFSYLASSVVE
jgi:competence protein ComEC